MTKPKHRTRATSDHSITPDPSASHAEFTRRGGHSAFFSVGLLVVLAVYVAHCAYFWAYVNDDAYITFRYSRFLSMGRGPYYNVGEHVEGYTNFLLMLLLTPIIGVFGPHAAAPSAKVLGIACGGLTLISIAMLVRRLDQSDDAPTLRSSVASILAAGLVAVSPAFALNSVSGLETLLLAGGLSLGLFLGHFSLEQGRWRGACVAFACAALTRPEGILFFGIYCIAQFIIIWSAARPSIPNPKGVHLPRPAIRILAMDAMIVGLVFAAHLAFRLVAYDGEWFPNTYYAKSGGFWKVSAAPYISNGILKPFFDRYGIGVGIGVVAWCFSGSTRRKSLPLFCVAAVGALLPFVTGSDWMLGCRLLMPFLPAVSAVVAIGWCRIAQLAIRSPSGLGSLLVFLSLPLLWYLHNQDRTGFHDHIEMRAHGYETGHSRLAQWLRSGAARPGDTIALMDIGIVGYDCIDQCILDITGLTDRKIAKSLGRFMNKQYDPEYVLNRKPELIVLVFGAKGNPDVPPPIGTVLKPWSQNEARIWEHPDFRAHYVHLRAAGKNPRHWTDVIAAKIGAERVFEHAHPGRYYLLAAFRRSEALTRPAAPISPMPRNSK